MMSLIGMTLHRRTMLLPEALGYQEDQCQMWDTLVPDVGYPPFSCWERESQRHYKQCRW